MNESLVTDEVISVSFDEGIQKAKTKIEQDSSKLQVDGFKGASRALFLAHLVESTDRAIVVLTPNQKTGESLISDLKYFYKFYNINFLY